MDDLCFDQKEKVTKKMHTISEIETNVPAFLGKLWKLVEDPETDDLICWAPNGRSFFIRNSAQFARDLLPHYYKHNNMASFVRQLNMYGFHKKVSVDLGGLKYDRDEMEFAHQYFLKDHPYLLDHIKRKIAPSKSQDGQPPVKAELMNKVLNEVRTMRGRQEHLDSKFGAMKRENEALWRELAMLRRKHLKQQEIVNKLIHFLVTLVQSNRNTGLPVKRRFPLMIDHHQRSKQMKMNKPEPSPTGPVIHELDASEHDQHEQDLESEYIVAEMLENQQNPIDTDSEYIDANLDDASGTLQFVDCTSPLKKELQILEAHELSQKHDTRRKSKKQRKNKVPVKILIPPSKHGRKLREETITVNPPSTVAPAGSTTKKSSKPTKAIPQKSFRSSKLAAMAANMNKMSETEADLADSTTQLEDPKEMIDVMEIADILAASDDIITNEETNEDNSRDANEMKLYTSKKNTQKVEDLQDFATNNDAGTSSKSSDLSLSCVNGSGMSNAAYRSEVNNHLELMDNNLDSIRDLLNSERCSIDANMLKELFGPNADPGNFGIPMNPELNPNVQDGDGEIDSNEFMDRALTPYIPSSNSFFDIDDSILLGTDDMGLINSTTNQETTSPYNYEQDPLELKDSKTMIFDDFLAENNPNSNASL